jgi:hypothetical protein
MCTTMMLFGPDGSYVITRGRSGYLLGSWASGHSLRGPGGASTSVGASSRGGSDEASAGSSSQVEAEGGPTSPGTSSRLAAIRRCSSASTAARSRRVASWAECRDGRRNAGGVARARVSSVQPEPSGDIEQLSGLSQSFTPLLGSCRAGISGAYCDSWHYGARARRLFWDAPNRASGACTSSIGEHQ